LVDGVLAFYQSTACHLGKDGHSVDLSSLTV
jgi:hypothetical protein